MKTINETMKTLALCVATVGFATAALADWTYDVSEKTISDGNWTLKVSASGQNLTVTGFTSADDLSDLDLRGAVTGTDEATYAIVGVKGLNVADVQAGLTRVVLPDSLTSLGTSAFEGCKKLTSVTPLLPASLTSFGQRVFCNCPIQGDLVMGREKSISFSVSGGNNDQYGFYNTCIRSATLGQYVKGVYGFMFQNSTNLESVVFEGPVTRFDYQAFCGCKKLAHVTPLLPPTVNSIGVEAFRGCPIEGPLSLGEGVASVGFGGNGGHWDGSTFVGSKITEFIAGTGVTAVVGSMFNGVTTLTNVVFKGALKSVGYNSFNGCTNLRRVTPLLPPSVKTLEYGSFRSCPIEGVLTLGVDSAVSYTGEGGHNENYSFGGSHITDFIAGTNLTSVPGSFFNTCSTLTNVDLTAATNLSSIGNYTFKGNTALKTISFATLKPTIGYGVFDDSIADYKGRFLYPKKSVSWADYITSLGTGFTEWSAASESATNTYWANFPDGPEPRGFASVSGRRRWFVPVSDAIVGTISLMMDGEVADGTILEVGASSPAYGDQGVVETPVPVAVSQYGEQSDVAYESYGYRVYAMGTGYWELQDEVLGVRSFDFDPRADGDYRLAWLWKPAAYAVKVDPVDPSVGSVSVDGTLLDAPTLEGTYYVSNTVITLTARSGGLEFKRWFGDVPAGEETSNEIRVTVDGIKKLSAYFETPWTYDDTTKTISDGYWTLGVSGSTSGLTISSVKKMPAGLSLLDLSKSTDGHVVTAIDQYVFSGNAQLVEVVLPSALTSLSHGAFKDCPHLMTVMPLLPATVTWMGLDVFRNSPVQGDLVMGRENAIGFYLSGGHNDQSSFRNTAIRSVVLGEKMTAVYGGMFQSCTNLESVVFEGAVTYIGYQCFCGCTKLAHVTPFLPPTVNTVDFQAFYACPVEGTLSLGEAANVYIGVDGGHDQCQTFKGTKITEFIAGAGFTSVRGMMFENVTTLTNVVFKGELTNVGYNSFGGCTALKTVEPLLPPSLKAMDYGAFCNCPIEGILTLGMTNNVSFGGEGGDGHNNGFQGSKLSEVHLGPALTWVPNELFRYAGRSPDFYLYGKPTFAEHSLWDISSNARFFLNLDEPSWNVWLADEANATAWTNLTPEAQAVYYGAWGAGAKRPKARAVKSLAPFPQNSWLFRFRPRTDGMRIIFR